MTGVNFFKPNDGYQGDYTTWTGDGSQNATMEFGSVRAGFSTTGNNTYTILNQSNNTNFQYIVQNLIIYNNGLEPCSYKLEVYRVLGALTGTVPICQAHTILPQQSFQFFSKDAPLILGDYRGNSSDWCRLQVTAMSSPSSAVLSNILVSFIRHKE